jgi:HlyD family secretion protein
MIRRYLLPLAAVLGLGVAIVFILHDNRPAPVVWPAIASAKAPFPSYVAGTGLVEASSENITVGTPVSGIVTAIYVTWGEPVKAGASLLRIDDRDLQAQLPLAKAKVREAEAGLAQLRSQLKFAQSVPDPRAISAEELSNRRHAVAIGEAALVSAQARVEQLGLEIDRRTVRALVPGRVLQIKTHLGEWADGSSAGLPLMLLGGDTRLHLRVDIDQSDAWRVRPDAAALAFVRGDPALKTPLRFERIEPYVVPKASFTGESTARADTRVLQVIFSFDPAAFPVYVGQQMDVYIQAPPLQAANNEPSALGGLP